MSTTGGENQHSPILRNTMVSLNKQLIDSTFKTYDNLSLKIVQYLLKEQIWWLKLKEPKLKTIGNRSQNYE